LLLVKCLDNGSEERVIEMRATGDDEAGQVGRPDAPLAPDAGEIVIGALLGIFAAHRDKALIFFCDGRPVKAVYHVTEVEAGTFSALDCGANPEAWTEFFHSALGCRRGRPRHMTAGRFAAIIRKVTGN
jgi:hypothetical protein